MNIISTLKRQGTYGLLALVMIAICIIAHLLTAANTETLYQATIPLYGAVACAALLLICFASPKTGLIRLFFVAGALTTFWIQ